MNIISARIPRKSTAKHGRRPARVSRARTRSESNLLAKVVLLLAVIFCMSEAASTFADVGLNMQYGDAAEVSLPCDCTSLQVPSWPPRQTLYYDGRRLRYCRPRKKVRRTREDIRREQQALLEKTKREIEALVAEFHAKLPREKANAIGAIYARFSTRFQDSIADQVRTLYEKACQEGIFVPAENIYFDLAVRGWKDRRPGLDALREAIKQNGFKVLLVFTTSRLFRRAYKSMQFVEEQLIDRGYRAIFVKSNLDTADGENWRMMFQFLASMDEAMVRMYSAHILASLEGLFIRGMVWTSLPLGYIGEVIPGEFTKRNEPRRRIVIDPETAPWIERIFRWYVVDGKSLDEIAQLLNDDDDAPVPNKSLTGLWTHALVRTHLRHPGYRGFWVFGAKRTEWKNDGDYPHQVSRDQPLRSGNFEHLRIIPDDTWYRAQNLLAEEPGNSGRKPKDGERQSRPRLLRGLFICPEHGRQLAVGGPDGQSLICPLCRAIKAEKRPLYSYLNRALATRLTCEKLAELVRSDEALVARIVVACQRAAEAVQKPDPEALKRLRAQASKLSSTIDFNRRNPGESDAQQRQTQLLLKDLNHQHTMVLGELASKEAIGSRIIVVPAREEVGALLGEFGEILAGAGNAETSDHMRAPRRIIDELTGGRIELFQMGHRKARRGWLQGRFRVDILSYAISKLNGVRPSADDSEWIDVVIDYRAPRLIDEQAEAAKRLWDEGLLNKEIARRLGCLPAYVSKIIYHWFDSRGLDRPDGRRRRAQLENKQLTVPLYKAIADEVVKLMDDGFSNLQIAKLLHTSDTTVAKSIAWWFKVRGLPAPTANDRRRMTLQRANALYVSGVLLRDIARQLGYSSRGLKLALKKHLAELGESMPDGRARRGNANSGKAANGSSKRDDDRRLAS